MLEVKKSEVNSKIYLSLIGIIELLGDTNYLIQTTRKLPRLWRQEARDPWSRDGSPRRGQVQISVTLEERWSDKTSPANAPNGQQIGNRRIPTFQLKTNFYRDSSISKWSKTSPPFRHIMPSAATAMTTASATAYLPARHRHPSRHLREVFQGLKYIDNFNAI